MLSIWHLHLAQWTIDCGRCLGHSWLESEPHEKVGQGAICHGQRPSLTKRLGKEQSAMDNGRTLISIKDVTKVYRMGGRRRACLAWS